MFKKILHDPLVHFLVLGALVFFLYTLMNNSNTNDENHIVISKATQKQLAYRWQKKQMRPPTQEEMQKMLDKEVYTEVMYKEALKMGLDQNDLIIRRRLAQKLEFVSNDLSSLINPTEDALKTYYKKHKKKFQERDKTSFIQIYIDPNKHRNDLKETLSKIKNVLDRNGSIQTLGDSFMLEKENRLVSEDEIIRTFGKAFLSRIKLLKSGIWEGPVKSAYGLHFVFIQKREEGEFPSFERIKSILKNAWMSEKKEKNNQAFYKNLKKMYTIEIEK